VLFLRAKPVDNLYKEIADLDLIVVPDALLASAHNRRLDRQHLERSRSRGADSQRDGVRIPPNRLVFLEIVAETDLDWKRTV
jgi:hypothetical protein